jgi:hypothetical protein
MHGLNVLPQFPKVNRHLHLGMTARMLRLCNGKTILATCRILYLRSCVLLCVALRSRATLKHQHIHCALLYVCCTCNTFVVIMGNSNSHNSLPFLSMKQNETVLWDHTEVGYMTHTYTHIVINKHRIKQDIYNYECSSVYIIIMQCI